MPRAGGRRLRPIAPGSPNSALSTRLSSPRSVRDTWRASSSRSAAPAPIRRRKSPTVSLLFHVTTPRPRRIRQEAGRPASERCSARSGASPGSTTNSRCVRPPARLSEPRARKRPRRWAIRQCSAAPCQAKVVRASRSGRSASRPSAPAGPSRLPPPSRRASRTTRRASIGSRPALAPPSKPARSAATSHALPGSMAASSARRAATRSRSPALKQPPPGLAHADRLTRAPRRAAVSRSETCRIAAARRSGSW